MLYVIIHIRYMYKTIYSYIMYTDYYAHILLYIYKTLMYIIRSLCMYQAFLKHARVHTHTKLVKAHLLGPFY